jgi:phage FluMu gp28-like protein
MSRPDHAKNFKGRAKNIPARDTFLLKYQARWVNDPALMRLMEKSRRTGISFATAYDHVRRRSLRDCQVDTWFSSRDELTAREWILYCKNFASVLDKGARDLGERVIDEKGTNAHVLQFSNGRRINSLAGNADAFAGKGGDWGLDEFALRKPDPAQVYAIASPTGDWGGRGDIISTHRGTANFFNQLVLEIKHKGNPKGISLHTVTLQDALDQGFLWKLQTKLAESDPRMQMDETDYFNYIRSRCRDEETFLQEYMCVPSDDNSAFLSYDLIDGCKYGPLEKWERTVAELARGENPLFVGLDIGRMHDLTSLWLDEKVGGVSLCRMQLDLKRMPFSQQEAIIYPIFALPNMRRACIDNTGIGMQFAERAQERFGEYRIEPVTFTAPVKEELAYPVRAALEDRSCRIPDREDVIGDFRGIRKETTAAGNIRFSGERSESGHCDRFWAKALALHATKGPSGFQCYTLKNLTRGGIATDRFNRRVIA